MSASHVFKPSRLRLMLKAALAVLLCLVTWPLETYGQAIPDPGDPTALEFWPTEFPVGQSTPVIARLLNDEAIEAIWLRLVLNAPDTDFVSDPGDFVHFDSVTYFPMPQHDPQMLDYRSAIYFGNATGDGSDTLALIMHCSNPPHVPIPANLDHPFALFWFTGVAPGWFTLSEEDLAQTRLYPEGTPIGDEGYFHPTFITCPNRFIVVDTVTPPDDPDPICGDRGEPDGLALTDISESYPIGESTPISVSFHNDEPLHIFNSTLRLHSVDGAAVDIDSIHYVGRLADPSVCSFRIVYDGWADGVLPDSIGVSVTDIGGVPLPVGSGPLFQVFLSGTNSGQVEIDASAGAKPLCDDGSVDSKYYVFWSHDTFITVGEALPPAPAFQPIVNPAPVVTGETVTFTVEASSPLSNPIDLNLLSLHLYDDNSIEPMSTPIFGAGGVFTWTPGSSDIGIWRANFEAVDLSTERSTTAYAVIQVVSAAEYLVSYFVGETVDALPANSLVHGNFDEDGAPEVMVAGDGWGTDIALAVYDGSAYMMEEAYTLGPDLPNRGLALGYIDQDSYLDAVTCLFNEVWVLLGGGNNSFSVVDANVPRPSGAFVDALLADYNGDAYLDYVCLSAPNVVTIYAGGPNASFSQTYSFDASASVQSLAAADLNNDGWEDLTIGTNQGLEVYLNDGLGAYDLTYSYPQDMGAYDIDITDQGSDFNGDGIFDLCVAAPGTGDNTGFSHLQVYFGQGDGSYQVANVAVVQGTVNGSRAGDFNGDQLLDIAFINSTERYLAIVFGDGTGTFADQLRFDVTKFQPRRMDCMDIDLDGDLDLVVASWEFDVFTLHSSLFVYLNNLNPGSMVSASMRVAAMDNVDVGIDGGDGQHLDKVSSTMPSASLYRRDLNGNESIDLEVKASAVNAGYHALTVTPRPNQPSGGTFSLDYTMRGETIQIVRNLPAPPQEYVFPFYPDGNSKVSPFQGRCIRSEHPIFEWDLEQQPVPTIHRQSSLPFSDAPIEFRIASDADFTNVLETGTVTSGRYILRTALDVVDTVSYFWQIRNSGSTDWGGIFVFHALPVNEIPKDPVDTDANADDGLADETGGGGEVPSGNEPSGDSLSQYGETGAETPADNVPHQFALQQNQPNPFNPTTRLNYSLAHEGHVRLDIYNILGNRVATLVDEYQAAGDYEVTWDASRYASGVYLYRISMDGFSATKKMLLVK